MEEKIRKHASCCRVTGNKLSAVELAYLDRIRDF